MPKYRVKFPEIIAVQFAGGEWTWELPDGTTHTEYGDGSANVTFLDFYEEIKDEGVYVKVIGGAVFTSTDGTDWHEVKGTKMGETTPEKETA